jgi:hypothetical protein
MLVDTRCRILTSELVVPAFGGTFVLNSCLLLKTDGSARDRYKDRTAARNAAVCV